MAQLADQRYNPDDVSEQSIPDFNNKDGLKPTNIRGPGLLTSARTRQPEMWVDPTQPVVVGQGRQDQVQGGLGGGGLGPGPRPVEPAPGPGIDPTDPPPGAPVADAPSGSPPPDASTSSPPGNSSSPGTSSEQEGTRPGYKDTYSFHDYAPRPDVEDPDNWAYGLVDNGDGALYDPRTGMYYDYQGRKIRQTRTGPTQPGYTDPGDGPVYTTPGGGSQWGVNPIDWVGQNMQINTSPSVSVEGMMIDPHTGQVSEDVPVGSMSQAQTHLAQQTDLSGLTGENAVDIDSGPDAEASGYDAHTQEVNPDHLASNQMGEILSEGSLLNMRARQEGILSAARRGLSNTSIAAGAALGAMVDRAQPLALANAQQYQQQDLANQAALNSAAQFNTNWDNQMEQLNKSIRSQESTAEQQLGLEGEIAAAQISSAENQFNAEMQNRTEQFNAQWENQAQMLRAELQQQNNQFNASQQNAIDMHIMQLNTALNEQYLRGSQALDLATIQGQFSSLIAQNEVAANLFATHLSSIGQVMSNDQISPATIASYVEIQQNLLQNMLQMLADLNNIQFNFDPYGGGGGSGDGGSTGGGSNNNPIGSNNSF